MSPTRQDAAQSISPVLFLTVEGKPMSFYLRPGPLKRKLQPLITAGGGTLCKVQQREAILLIDPEEKPCVPESAAHWYVSTQYILDCVEKEEQLDIEDYRLNPEVIKRPSRRSNSSGGSPSGLSGGRVAYTAEDDNAILKFVSKRKAETTGNRLWQEMEKQRVTGHSWQSMKSRYKDRLAKNQPAAIMPETKEDDSNKLPEKNTEVKLSEELNAGKGSCDATVGPFPTHSADSDQTQIDVQLIPAARTSEHVETQILASVGVEEIQTTEEELNNNVQSGSVEGENSHCCQSEEQADNKADTETPEPERNGPLTAAVPQKPNLSKSPAQLKLSAKTTSPKQPEEKPEASSMEEQPQRRLTRRQLELEASSSSPEPYGKKLRSSSNTPKRSIRTPQPSKKPKSAVMAADQRAPLTEEPQKKKARGEEAAAEAESQVEQNSHNAETKTAQADEAKSAPQETAKEKRQLGILEMATKEFEDDSEPDENDGPDLQKSSGAAALSAATPQPSDTSADLPCAQANPATGPSPQEPVPETRASCSIRVPNTGSPEAGAARPTASGPVSAPSKAHLFIFDSESQQDDSQPVVGEGSAAPSHPQRSGDAAFSLTQVHLEEDKQRIRELMNQTKQGLVSVTKALLKTSGDFAAAADLLLNPSSVSAAFWIRRDDGLLRSADPVVRQKLQEKYGEENVAKRILFLETEG
ncbi:LOW QUALITY PROTEIN: telomeric repeat-binding factor 2-interacting protein 1 [Fundulus heteroclitus]|uniref:LOW QUALITY PROTEIN: telomeric repeat-binding factor 2-interacting protein 1 n=1 Tax=Fundulus heteroclitus TaxID=8078 RepID=UPI00165A5C8B|nr:LOW QUALITY PROTEIN: telomeric repeat-binding factor 2-interacting protein 1 [Fundulus heteroclitus]